MCEHTSGPNGPDDREESQCAMRDFPESQSQQAPFQERLPIHEHYMILRTTGLSEITGVG